MPNHVSPSLNFYSSAWRANRRPKHALRALLLVLLLMVPELAAARWYQVDVVVFRHTRTSTAGAEQFPAMTALPDYSAGLDLTTDVAATGAEPSAGGPGPIAFKALAANERGLVDVERRLRNSHDYTPLLAAAWRQPKAAVGGAKRVHLSDIDTWLGAAPASDTATGVVTADVTPGVAGTVLVKIARQMNVDIDFTLDHDGTPVRLKGARGVKLREVNYFDHPLFGVLVQVLPYDLPDDDPAAGSASDEPLDDGATGGVESSSALPEPD